VLTFPGFFVLTRVQLSNIISEHERKSGILQADAMSGTGVPENIRPSDLCQAIVETTSTALFIISEGRVLYANPAFETLTGYSSEELGERGVLHLFPDPSEAGAHLRSGFGGQAPGSWYETEITTRNAEKRWVAVAIAPVNLPTPAFLGTMLDITGL
jgi:PAS domain S-box-containing protein